MAKPTNPNCAKCGVLKTSENTLCLTNGKFFSMCRPCAREYQRTRYVRRPRVRKERQSPRQQKGRASNPNCARCDVQKTDANTARIKTRHNSLGSYCRLCVKAYKKERLAARGVIVKERAPRDSCLIPARRVPRVTEEMRALRKELKASPSFRRFEKALDRLGAVLTQRLQADPSLEAFRRALHQYEYALVDAANERSKRGMHAAMLKVADQPHVPYLNVIACRECTRELSESITYTLEQQHGKAGVRPRECRERIEAQHREAQATRQPQLTRWQEDAALDKQRSEEDWQEVYAGCSHFDYDRGAALAERVA